MKQSLKKIAAITGILAGMSFGAMGTHASTLTINLTNEDFSGAFDPAGPPGTTVLTAVFDDEGTPGSVKLTLSESLTDVEHVKLWMFNFNPAKDVMDLSFLNLSGPHGTVVVGQDPQDGDTNYKANGVGGEYSIEFAFPNAAADRFEASDTTASEWMITGVADLVASDFNFLSAPFQSSDQVGRSAAHIGGIGDQGEESGWIKDGPPPPPPPGPPPISEPGMIGVFGLSLVALGLIRRRRRA